MSAAANGTTTEFLFNAAGQRVSEWDASTHAQLKGHYYWGATPVAFYTTASDGGAAAHFEHQDWLGTERMRTSYNGGVEGQYQSLPWGDGQSSSGSDQDAYHYATLDYDSESNTSHAQFRQYSSTEGRFLSPDPYGGSYDPTNPQSLNRYEYALDNPLSNIDPSGLDGCDQYDESGFTDFGGCNVYVNGGDGSCDMSDTSCQLYYEYYQSWINDQSQSSQSYGGYSGGGVGGGSGGGSSTGPRSGYESLFCLGDALKSKNGVSLAFDAASIAAGALPGGATTAGIIKIGVIAGVGSFGTAYSAVTSPSGAVGGAKFILGTAGTDLALRMRIR